MVRYLTISCNMLLSFVFSFWKGAAVCQARRPSMLREALDVSGRCWGKKIWVKLTKTRVNCDKPSNSRPKHRIKHGVMPDGNETSEYLLQELAGYGRFNQTNLFEIGEINQASHQKRQGFSQPKRNSPSKVWRFYPSNVVPMNSYIRRNIKHLGEG